MNPGETRVSRLGSAFRWSALAINVAVALIFLVPWWTGPCGTDPDSSLGTVLHVTYAARMSFAREIVCPFGPYGFLYNRSYHPATYTVALTAWGFFALVLLLLAWHRPAHESPSPPLSFLHAFLLILLSMMSLDTIFFMFMFGFVEPRARKETSAVAVRSVLTVAMALAGLVKFTFFILGAALVFLDMIGDLTRRRWPGLALVYIASVGAFWLLAGQRIVELPAFVTARVELSRSYTGAMARAGPSAEVVGFVVAAMAAWGVAAVLHLRARGEGNFVFVAGLATLLLVVFKEGFVRHDEHAVIAFTVLTLVACALYRRARGFPGIVKGVALVVLVLTTSLLAWGLRLHAGEGLIRHAGRIIGTSYDRLAAAYRFVADPSRMKREFEAYAEDMKSQYPLPSAHGTVDGYSYNQTAMILAGLDYRPRPVFQSYLTYSDALASLNVQHLLGLRAADYLFLRVNPIDTRYPSLDDGLSWPQLLMRYEVVDDLPDLLVLRKRSSPLAPRFLPLRRLKVPVGQSVTVPSDPRGLIWARLSIRLTGAGACIETLFKGPHVYIRVYTRRGDSCKYTLVPRLCRGGFLLSPLVSSHHDFAKIYTRIGRSSLSDSMITAFAIEVDDRARFAYAQHVSVELDALDTDVLEDVEGAER